MSVGCCQETGSSQGRKGCTCGRHWKPNKTQRLVSQDRIPRAPVSPCSLPAVSKLGLPGRWTSSLPWSPSGIDGRTSELPDIDARPPHLQLYSSDCVSFRWMSQVSPKRLPQSSLIVSSLPSHRPHPKACRCHGMTPLASGRREGRGLSLSQAHPSSAYTKGNTYVGTSQQLLSCPGPGPHSWPSSKPNCLCSFVSCSRTALSPSHGPFDSLSNPLAIGMKVSLAYWAFSCVPPMFLTILEASELIFSLPAHLLEGGPTFYLCFLMSPQIETHSPLHL